MSRRNFRGGGAVIVIQAVSGDEMDINVGDVDIAKAWLSGRYDIRWTEVEGKGSHVTFYGTDYGGVWPRNVKQFMVYAVSFALGDEWFERIEKL